MFISSMVNNDNLIICLSGVLFLTALQSTNNLSTKNLILVGIFSGLVFLTKYTGIIILVFIAIFMLLHYLQRKNSVSYFRSVILVGFVVGLIILPLLLHNKATYGAFIPLSVGAPFPNWDSPLYGMYRAFKNFFNTFWGVAGKTNDIKFIPAMLLGNLFALTSLYGIVKGLFKKDSYIQKVVNVKNSFMTAMLISVIIGFITVIYYGIVYGQAQGRFLFPLIIPVGIWMSLGLKNVIGERVENYKFLINTIAVFVISAVTFTAYTLFRINAS
jgi:4-amino-4-deoxy-L-arabinose transferase-like glycosyltransferase